MPRKILGLLTEALIDNASDATVAIDKEGKIHLYNPAAAQVFGQPLASVIGRKVWDVLPLTPFLRAFIAMIKESNPTFTERTYSFPDDRLFLGQLLPVRNEEGRLAGAVAVLKDMTHLSNIEQHVSDFVSNMSQQIRIPLTSIKGFVETLLEGAMADPTVTRKFLQVINEETNRMVRLLVSLSEATTAPPETPASAAPMDIGPVVRRAAEALRPMADQKGLKLEIDVADPLPRVNATEHGLTQVVTNLVDNAIKFSGISDQPGRIRLRVATVNEHVVVTVADDGIGIEASEHERIFGRFYRVTEGPGAQLGGTGLGLAISRDIARTFGGDIQVQSAPLQGATFRFTLPVPAARETRPASGARRN